jgi:hypothetical protein
MKKYILHFALPIILGIVFVSCTTPKIFFNHVKKYPLSENRLAIINCDSISYISNKNFYASNLDSIKKFNLKTTKYKVNDTIRYYKSYEYKSNEFNNNTISCYQVEINNDTIWVFNPNVIDLELYNQITKK